MIVDTQILGIGSRVKHPAFGDGVIIKINKAAYEVCYTIYGIKNVGKEYDNWEIIEAIPNTDQVSFTAAEKSLMKVLRKWSDINEVVPLGDRWNNGTLILKPENEQLKAKEIPIDTFFHKIVMVRDRIRVMEQKINSNKKLSDEEKIDLQQYITRIYGSLTTFNVLFKYKEDYFKGEKSK